jgi:hypothetical protein
MKYPKYPIIASVDPYTYEFYSEGPRGRIKKAIFFTPIGKNLYNLGFGDWNEETQDVDDSSRSNNGDRDRVIATVAFTAIEFIERFQDAQIVIVGSTPARTRLYQMGIAFNYMEIKDLLEIQGLIKDRWETFELGVNYKAFLITRK